MAAKAPRYPFVRLVWLDAHSRDAVELLNPTKLDDFHKAHRITTVGWVLRDDADGVTIAGEWLEDDDYRNGTFIPRGMVVRMEPITKGRKRVPKALAEASSFDHGVTPH